MSQSLVNDVGDLQYGRKNGYGVKLWNNKVSDIYAVNSFGWDRSGIRSFPNPADFKRDVFYDKHKVITIRKTNADIYVRYAVLDNFSYAVLWFSHRADALTFVDQVNLYLQNARQNETTVNIITDKTYKTLISLQQ